MGPRAVLDDTANAEAAAPAKRPVPLRRLILVLAIVVGVGAGWFVLRRQPDPDRLWADAERAFLAGDRDRTRIALKILERLRPRTGLDRMLEAQLATADGRLDDALGAIGRIADDHPIAAQAHLLAGRIERQRHCLRKAEVAFRHALAIKPGLIEAHNELIYILGIQSRRREVDAEFRALSRLTPLSHHDLFTWALTHFSHWNPDIVEDLDGFIRADPQDRYSRLAVAELLLESPERESYIANILEPLPDSDPDALALRINLAFNMGRFEDAERRLASAPAGHPRISRIRGELALRRRDLDGAIRHFREALGAEPYDRVSPMQLAQALRLKGETDAAEAYVERVRRLNRVYNLIVRVRSPKHENQVSDLTDLGKACEEAGLIDEARGWYRRAIAENPLDGTAQQGLHRLAREIDASPPSAGHDRDR
jgi:tetratricopeptide (TPR) repeat protein